MRPCFHFEIFEEVTEDIRKRFSDSIVQHLVHINADFREAWHEYPETRMPEVHLHRLGEGPFKADAGRIKQIRKIKIDR